MGKFSSSHSRLKFFFWWYGSCSQNPIPWNTREPRSVFVIDALCSFNGLVASNLKSLKDWLSGCSWQFLVFYSRVINGDPLSKSIPPWFLEYQQVEVLFYWYLCCLGIQSELYALITRAEVIIYLWIFAIFLLAVYLHQKWEMSWGAVLELSTPSATFATMINIRARTSPIEVAGDILS